MSGIFHTFYLEWDTLDINEFYSFVMQETNIVYKDSLKLCLGWTVVGIFESQSSYS